MSIGVSTGNNFYIGTAVASGVPISMAAFFWSTSGTNANQTIISISDTNQASDFFRLIFWAGNSSAGDESVYATTSATTAVTAGIAPGTISLNAWHHAAAVFSATNARAVYYEGTTKGTNTGSRTPTGLDKTSFGRIRTSSTSHDSFQGYLAEMAIWNVALTDAEVVLLSQGYSPLLIHPQNLLVYVPGIRNLLDVVGGNAFTIDGSLSVGNQPKVRYPSIHSVGITRGLEMIPDDDIAVGDWLNENDETPLYPSISEVVLDDATYVGITSPSEEDYFEVALGDSFEDDLGTQTMKVIWRAYNAGDGTVDLKCELREGSTIIASDEQTLTSIPATYTFTLTQDEFDSIKDEEDLRLRFIVTGVS